MLTLAGLGLLASAVAQWSGVRFGQLDPRVTMREAIPAVTLLMLGLQTVFTSFVFSLFTLGKR